MGQHPAGGHAHLPRMAHAGADDAGGGGVQVRIRENHAGSAAAKLQVHALQSGGPGGHDLLAHLGAAGVADDVHLRRRRQQLRHLAAGFRQHVDDARRQPLHFGQHFKQLGVDQGGLRSGLDHAGAAGRHGWRQRAHQQGDRGVPRHNDAGHSHRFPGQHGELILIDFSDPAKDVAGQARVVAQLGNGGAHLVVGVADQLAVLPRQGQRYLPLGPLQPIREGQQHGGAHSGLMRPGGVLEGVTGGGNGGLAVLGLGVGKAAQRLASAGVDALGHGAAG